MLPVSVTGYYLLNRIHDRAGLIWLSVVSLFFIGYTNYMYLILLLPNLLFNYLIAYAMDKAEKKRFCLIVGIVIDIGILLVFKYSGFFIESVNTVFSKDYEVLNIILPLGISFYTFQQISFLVDCYRDRRIQCDLLEYIVYICFYPQFLQGPIVLAGEMIPQLRDGSRKDWNPEYAVKGLSRFILGLAKKVIIADGVAVAVDGGYANLTEVGTVGALVLIFGYALQIYFDFSGYSDMAVGLGLLFNIDLPENFNSPYKAANIDEFWDRWHITLTRFFTKYVYIPLGGSRKGVLRAYTNILIVFLLSGLWHGAEWSFIIWGLLHGIAMLISRVMKDIRGREGICTGNHLSVFIGKAVTFIYVSIAWVFFRAADTAEALEVLRKLIRGGHSGITDKISEPFSKLVEVSWFLRLDILDIDRYYGGIMIIVVLAMLIVICLVTPNTKELTLALSKRLSDRNEHNKASVYSVLSAFMMTVLLVWCVLGFTGVTEYVYWNF